MKWGYSNKCEICGKGRSSVDHSVCSKIKQQAALKSKVKVKKASRVISNIDSYITHMAIHANKDSL